MTANEDPGPSSEATGPARPSDDLENWLSDLRTDVAADPSGWTDQNAPGQNAPGQNTPNQNTAGQNTAGQNTPGQRPTGPAPERTPFAPEERRVGDSRPSGGGRHRAAD